MFTTQKTWLWCTAADVQIIRNIVRHTTDHTRANQSRYFDYMRAHDRYAIPVSDGTDPGGWAAGLRHYVDSRYRVVASTSFSRALRSAVTNLRKTNLPVAIAVDHGNHGWVLTGFTATADPARTTSFTVTSVRVVGPLCGPPEPVVRLRHAAGHAADAEPVQVVLHAVALRPRPDGLGRRLGLDPADRDLVVHGEHDHEDVDDATRRRPRRRRRTFASSRDRGQLGPSAEPDGASDPDRDARDPGDARPTTAPVAVAAGPATGGAAARAARGTTPASARSAWDPWTIVGLGAAALLVLAAALLGGPGRGRPGQSVGASPNCGNSAAPNVVISAIRPSTTRRTSNLNARKIVSPGERR